MRGDKVFAGLGWSSAASVVNLAAQFAFMAVLARVLSPADFGTMAMAAIAIRFASFFAQAGAAQILQQHADADAALCSAAFWVALVASLLCYGAVVLAAPLFAAYFRLPQLERILATYGLVLPLMAVASLPMAYLRRQGRFQEASALDVIGYLFGYGLTGIGLALQGHGVWSLVAATLAQQGLLAVLALLRSRYPVSLEVPRSTWAKLLGQGGRYSLIGFLEFLWANVETLVLGRRVGEVALGLWNRAQLLCNLPVEQTWGAAAKVMFPALSSLQRDRVRLADGFLLTILGSGVIATAFSAGLAVAAPDVVALLLGHRWRDAAPLVAVLALGVPALFVYVGCGLTLDSLAALGAKLRLQALLLLLKLALVLAASSHGTLGVAWAVVACEWVRALLGVRLVAQVLAVPMARLREVAAALASVALVVGVCVLAAQGLVRLAGWPAWLAVLLQALAGAAGLLALIVMAWPRWSRFAPLQHFEGIRQRLGRLERLVQRPTP